MTLNPSPRKTDPMLPAVVLPAVVLPAVVMLPALRPLLYAIVATGLLWSANAHALPASAHHREHREHRGAEARNHVKERAHAITLSAQSKHLDFASLFSERGDACDKSSRDCLRNGRTQASEKIEKAKAKQGRRHWRRVRLSRDEREIVRSQLGRHGGIELHSGRNFEPIKIRSDQQPTHPIPEPHAALIFAFGIGIAAIRLRR